MAITSNAETKDDKALVERHLSLHPGAEHDLKFLKNHVVVFDSQDASEVRYTRRQYLAYLDGLEGPQEAPQAVTDLPPQASEPRSGYVEVTAGFDEGMLQALSDLAFEVGIAERQGDLSKNSARFERGELMIRLASVAQAERMPFKAVLERVNENLARRAAENTLADFQVITKEEATTTRKVVEAFGSSAEFRLVNAVNPNTGEPLVDDSGEPPLTSIREVPMNKLYAVVEYAGDKDLDALLSFTYRYPERVVKKAKSIAKNQGKPLAQLIKKLDKLRADGVHIVTGEAIKVQVNERTALEKLADWAGEAPAPDVVSIKTDRAWHDSFWTPLKALFTAMMQEYQPEMMGEAASVSNVFVFERTIGQFFNVNDESGLRTAITALIEAGDLTPDQASDFVSRFAWNPGGGDGSGAWEALAPAPEPDDEQDFEVEVADEDGFEDVEFEEVEDGFEDVEA